jgi:hypothetical protein
LKYRLEKIKKMKKTISIIITVALIVSCGKLNSHTVSRQTGVKDIKKDTANDLAVSLKVLNDSLISITVLNTGKSVIRAYSYVKTYENHYDYFEIEAKTPDNDQMVFVFLDDRDKSAPVIVELKPGESFSHTINLLSWSERSVNHNTLKKAGLYHLPHGIKIRAKYRNNPCDNCNEYYKSIWTGYVYSDWVNF